MKYGLSDKQLQEITGIISSYPQIEHAFIFGSRAINTYKEASDIDIAIKGSKVDSNLAAKLKDYLEEDTYLPFFFDVVAYNSIQSEELKKHIRTKGKAIYSKELEGWREYRFSKFVQINPQVKLQGGQKYSFVEMKDINESHKKAYSTQIRELKGGSRFINGDTLFARITPCLENGKICQIEELKNGQGFGSTEFLVFRGKDKVSLSSFVYYLSRWEEVRRFAESNLTGTSGRQRVSKIVFDELELPLPPLSEQKAIAEVLSSLDDKIDLLHRQNKTLEDMAQTLFRKWFIDEADEDWEVVEFGQFINCFNGVSYKSADLNPSTTAMVSLKSFDRDGGFRLDGFKQFTGKYKEQHVVTQGDLVVAHTDITQDAAVIGNPALVVSDPIYEKLVISMDLVKVCSKHTWLSNEFLYRMMRTREFKQHCLGYSNGSTVLHLSKQAIPSYEFFMPPKERILEYTKLAKNLFGKKFENITQVRTLEKLRDTLLPKLMSGEKRVLIDESIQGVY